MRNEYDLDSNAVKIPLTKFLFFLTGINIVFVLGGTLVGTFQIVSIQDNYQKSKEKIQESEKIYKTSINNFKKVENDLTNIKETIYSTLNKYTDDIDTKKIETITNINRSYKELNSKVKNIDTVISEISKHLDDKKTIFLSLVSSKIEPLDDKILNIESRIKTEEKRLGDRNNEINSLRDMINTATSRLTIMHDNYEKLIIEGDNQIAIAMKYNSDAKREIDRLKNSNILTVVDIWRLSSQGIRYSLVGICLIFFLSFFTSLYLLYKTLCR